AAAAFRTRTPAVPVAIAVATGTLVAARLAIGRNRAFAVGQNFTLVQPRFYADDAVGRMGLGEAVVDIGAERMKRKLPLEIPFAARDFSAVQTTGNAHFNAF